jgi:hypothetical protein
MADYWMYRWLDHYGVRNAAEVPVLLRSRSAIDELRVEAALDAEKVHLDAPPDSIVAGTGFDYSQSLDCASTTCRRLQAEEQFARAWHYFEHVVLADTIGDVVRHHAKLDRDRQFLSQVELHAAALLYLREIGAEEMVAFRQKPRVTLAEPGDEIEGESATSGAQKTLHLSFDYHQLAHEFAEHTKIEVRPKSKRIKVTVRHPATSVLIYGYFDPSAVAGLSPGQKKLKLSAFALRAHIEHIAADIAMTREFHAPLVIGQPLHSRLMAEITKREHEQPSVADVAMKLDLPIVTGIPLLEFLKLRKDNSDAFIRFSQRLRLAIHEHVKAAEAADSEKIAREIKRDLIEPELAAIKQRLALSTKVLSRKAAYSIALGGLATTCGLVAGVPGLVAGGALTSIASVLAATGKEMEERRDVELSDMYFVWKASHVHR